LYNILLLPNFLIKIWNYNENLYVFVTLMSALIVSCESETTSPTISPTASPTSPTLIPTIEPDDSLTNNWVDSLGTGVAQTNIRKDSLGKIISISTQSFTQSDSTNDTIYLNDFFDGYSTGFKDMDNNHHYDDLVSVYFSQDQTIERIEFDLNRDGTTDEIQYWSNNQIIKYQNIVYGYSIEYEYIDRKSVSEIYIKGNYSA
jgi:hypothetical protein